MKNPWIRALTGQLLRGLGCLRHIGAGVLFALFALPLYLGPAQAQGPAVTSTPTTTSGSRNVYVFGSSVRPSAEVAGDFVGAGGRVVIDQPIKGDVTLAGGSIDLRAPVGDDARVAGGDVSIENSIGGELFAVGGSVTLTKSGSVAQSAMVNAGSVMLEGKIIGPLTVNAQKIVINGEVGRDVELNGEQIELGALARIAGNLKYRSPGELSKADGAVVSGSLTRRAAMPMSERERWGDRDDAWRGHMMAWSGPSWFQSVFTFLALWASAAVFMLVFPGFLRRASAEVVASPWLALGVGVGAVVAVPFLAVMLVLTLIGIPFGIAAMAIYPLMLLLGWIVGVYHIGQLAERAVRKDAPGSFATSVGFFALALLLVMLVGSVMFVGFFAMFLIVGLGVGACVLEFRRQRQAGRDPPPAKGSATSASATAG